MKDYSKYLPYCSTTQQKNALDVLGKSPSIVEAAQTLGVNRRTLQRMIKRIEKNAIDRGYDPLNDMKRPLSEGMHIRRLSTNYDADGNIRQQWVIGEPDKDTKLESLIEALTDSFEDYKGWSEPVKAPKKNLSEIVTVYPMGDPHIGMYAWAAESGEDFNCEVAEKNLTNAIRNLVQRSPASETAIILNLGDFFHSDNMDNTTRRSGNVLDVDTRWPRVLKIGAKALITCVYSALQKHQNVIVRNVVGNHDEHTAMALSLALSLYFEGNDRVTIDDSPAPFWYYRFGKVMIGSTHGDCAKPDNLPGIMATDKAQDWGETAFRYWYTGHIHNLQRKEFPGCLWESFRTLAAKDAWHNRMGYRSGRDMVSIVLHEEFGEIERHTMSLEMLREGVCTKK